jgi:hypothetical protein
VEQAMEAVTPVRESALALPRRTKSIEPPQRPSTSSEASWLLTSPAKGSLEFAH